MLDKIAPYWKAVVGFFGPGIIMLCNPLLAGRIPTQAEWLIALGTALATSLGVYLVPNNAPATEDDAPPTEGTDGLPADDVGA
ncbi:MAG TPA: hypothetical protein VGK17_03010 [Propionicimonas sp.]|jgi:hypothetical protein